MKETKDPKMQHFMAPEGSVVFSPLMPKEEAILIFNKWIEVRFPKPTSSISWDDLNFPTTKPKTD